MAQQQHPPWGSSPRPQGYGPCALPTELGGLLPKLENLSTLHSIKVVFHASTNCYLCLSTSCLLCRLVPFCSCFLAFCSAFISFAPFSFVFCSFFLRFVACFLVYPCFVPFCSFLFFFPSFCCFFPPLSVRSFFPSVCFFSLLWFLFLLCPSFFLLFPSLCSFLPCCLGFFSS